MYVYDGVVKYSRAISSHAFFGPRAREIIVPVTSGVRLVRLMSYSDRRVKRKLTPVIIITRQSLLREWAGKRARAREPAKLNSKIKSDDRRRARETGRPISRRLLNR